MVAVGLHGKIIDSGLQFSRAKYGQHSEPIVISDDNHPQGFPTS
jgi:hypothetical protein